MSNLMPAPARIAELINDYIETERSNVEKYENRQLLDRSGTYTLHRLAADIYASGWSDGHFAAGVEARANR